MPELPNDRRLSTIRVRLETSTYKFAGTGPLSVVQWGMSSQPRQSREDRRRARRWINDQLREWADGREAALEALGWPDASHMHRIQLYGGFRADAGAGPDLTAPEFGAHVTHRLLTIERLVRDMPDEWRVVVVGVYLKSRSVQQIAAESGVEYRRVLYRLHDAQDAIVRACDCFDGRIAA